MAWRVKEVQRRAGVSVEQVQGRTTDTGVKTLVFNLQKITVRSSDYVKTLWLMGVDQHGYSVSVAVQDFSPTLLIKSPDTWDASDANAVDDLTDLVDTLHEATKGQGSSEKIKSVDFVLLTPAIGFTNGRQDRMIKITCHSLTDHALVVKYMESRKFTMYHEDIRAFTPAVQFLQQTGVEYQSWVEVTPIRYTTTRATHCSLEGYCMMEEIRPYLGEIKLSSLPLLKAFVRMRAVSRDGVVDCKYDYRFNPDLPCDRLVAIGVYYSWTHDHSVQPCHASVHTLIPTDAESPPMHRPHHTEQDMLNAFRDELVDMDPDEIFYFPDEFLQWEYFASRAYSQCTNASALRLERFKTAKAKVHRRSGHDIVSLRFDTRNMFNMEAALQKKPWIPVESYDLYTCSAHKDLRKTPAQLAQLLTDARLVNRHLARGVEGRRTIVRAMVQDLDLLAALELDTGMSGEFSNVSKASDTDLTDVVSRGEQIRVFNRLMHFYVDHRKYVNREQLAQKPLRFRASERPPTFRDPEELTLNTELREKCMALLQAKLNYHPAPSHKRKQASAAPDQQTANPWFVTATEAACKARLAPGDEKSIEDHDDDAEDEEAAAADETRKHALDAEEAEGGNVLKPSCGFWDWQRIVILDFASLYPSIMMAFNLDYSTIVFDPQYLDLPGVEYFTIPINKYETMVTANVMGMIPLMLRTFVDNRSAIKKRMKTETDPFRRKTLDFEQNSMKVLCNGTYGFTGAEKRGSLLALKPIMYMVTAMGRYLQKFCSAYVGRQYHIPTIYGDTDSIFVLIKLPDGHETMSIQDVTRDMGQRYAMERFFSHELQEERPFLWEHVLHYFMQRKKVDVSRFEKAHQINALYYLISSKLSDELSTLIDRPPVKLEFENLADKVWMSLAKKTYCYRFWDENNPSKVAKIKITGMPVKKREWTPWTRAVLMGVTERILWDRVSEIQAFVEQALDRLVEGRVPVRELTVSKGFKSKMHYKHFRQVHLQVMLKLEQRTRWPVKEKSRLAFVVLRGHDKLYLRSEVPSYAEAHNLELDLGYYLQNQFYNPMKKLLTYHPELFNFDELFRRYLKRLEMKDACQSSLTAETMGTRRLLTQADLITHFKKHRVQEVEAGAFKRKAAVSDTRSLASPDPFARFIKPQT